MAFTRDDLMSVATAAGWQRGTKLSRHPAPVRSAIVTSLRSSLTTEVLADAPRIFYSDRGQDKSRRMTIVDAVRTLIEELDGIPQ